jgi:hypothetical protein
MTMTMSREDRFVLILAEVESTNNPYAWGDHGCACGRWQQHPSFYLSWGPTVGDFVCLVYGTDSNVDPSTLIHDDKYLELTWDKAYEIAVRKFVRAYLVRHPAVTDIAIAMDYHLHGQIRGTGWDIPYAARWTEIEAKTTAIEEM